jgi:1,4-alpha-glucan branching enzyme
MVQITGCHHPESHAGAASELSHRSAARGKWREMLNSDAGIYGGGNKGNFGGVMAGNIHATASSTRQNFICRR